MHHGTHFGEGVLATRIFLMQVSVFPPLLWIKKCNVCFLLCNCYVMPSHSLIVKSKQNFYKFTLMNNIQEKKKSVPKEPSLLMGYNYWEDSGTFQQGRFFSQKCIRGCNSNSLPPNSWDRTIYSRAQPPKFLITNGEAAAPTEQLAWQVSDTSS